MSQLCYALLATAIFAATSAHGASLSVNSVQVTLIESSYMPDSIAFQIDKPVGACPAGAFLRWYARGADITAKNANISAVYSLLVTALASGKTLNLGVDDSNCGVSVFQINR